MCVENCRSPLILAETLLRDNYTNMTRAKIQCFADCSSLEQTEIEAPGMAAQVESELNVDKCKRECKRIHTAIEVAVSSGLIKDFN